MRGHVIDPSTTPRTSACVPVGSGLRVARVNFTHGDRTSTRLMAVHERNDWVSDMIARHGWWEIRGPLEFLNGLFSIGRHVRLPRPGGTFLDIGANIGYYSLLFADRGDRVIAIEPLFRNRAAIQATLCLNPDLLPRVRIVAVALGTQDDVANGVSCTMRPQVQRNLGNGVLECGRNHTCRSPEPPSADTLTQRTGMSVTLAQWRQLPCEEVPVEPLDTVLADLKPSNVKMAKIDIEGRECSALDGGETIFTIYRPRLLVAEWKAAHVELCMRRLATRHGYLHGRAWGADKNVALWDDDRGPKRTTRMFEPRVTTTPTSAHGSPTLSVV